MTSVDGGHANRVLQRLAREHHGRDTQALQVLYAIEGFLRRLSVSDYRERMVLKGGMLLAVLDARRMTRDADLSAHGISNDESSVAEIVAEIASIFLSEPDGVEFDTTAVSTEPMRESATYRGVRAKLPATIGVARIVVTLDLSFGDPGEVEEIRYPEILGAAGIPLLAYPLERTLAEKIATMMERGELNTRDRDFAGSCGRRDGFRGSRRPCGGRNFVLEPEDDAVGMSRPDSSDDLLVGEAVRRIERFVPRVLVDVLAAIEHELDEGNTKAEVGELRAALAKAREDWERDGEVDVNFEELRAQAVHVARLLPDGMGEAQELVTASAQLGFRSSAAPSA